MYDLIKQLTHQKQNWMVLQTVTTLALMATIQMLLSVHNNKPKNKLPSIDVRPTALA